MCEMGDSGFLITSKGGQELGLSDVEESSPFGG